MRLIDTSASADVDMAGYKEQGKTENSDKRYDDEDNIQGELRDAPHCNKAGEGSENNQPQHDKLYAARQLPSSKALERPVDFFCPLFPNLFMYAFSHANTLTISIPRSACPMKFVRASVLSSIIRLKLAIILPTTIFVGREQRRTANPTSAEGPIRMVIATICTNP